MGAKAMHHASVWRVEGGEGERGEGERCRLREGQEPALGARAVHHPDGAGGGRGVGMGDVRDAGEGRCVWGGLQVITVGHICSAAMPVRSQSLIAAHHPSHR